MEMPGKRSSYYPLRQFDDDEIVSAKARPDRDRLQIGGRMTNLMGLERDSSGSSGYDEVGIDVREDEFEVKSWAQQTEETYQLQLALALRLSAEATCADDPNFLDAVPDESAMRASLATPEALSHRFWVKDLFFVL